MRLWHEQMIPKLQKNQLLGQHRECCALRGMGGIRNIKQLILYFYILLIIYFAIIH